MNKNFYTIKEILFGLRKEYLELQKDINNLKQYMGIYSKKVMSFDLYILRKELMCSINKRRNRIQKLIDKIRYEHQVYLAPSKAYRNNNNEYIFPDIPVYVKKEYMTKFDEEFQRIFSKKFITESKEKYIEFQNDQSKFAINLDQNLFDLSIKSGSYEDAFFDYSMQDDLLVFISHNEIVSKEMISYILNVLVPKDKINEYYQELINSSDDSKKDIEIVGDFNKQGRTDLQIYDEGKRFVLIKK